MCVEEARYAVMMLSNGEQYPAGHNTVATATLEHALRIPWAKVVMPVDPDEETGWVITDGKATAISSKEATELYVMYQDSKDMQEIWPWMGSVDCDACNRMQEEALRA